ncbi:MAG: hypothetical protein WAU68_16740 [Vitreimonas sp.]
MQVTKLRVANDNGLVPAGRYFAHLAEGLREANERAAAVLDVYEEQERKLETRYRRQSASSVPSHRARQMEMALS